MATKRFFLKRVPIDRQGYDRGGSYWGAGEAPLYEYETPDGDIEYIRASDREHAKSRIVSKYPYYKSSRKPKNKKQHVTSSQIGGLFNPSKTTILSKLRKGIRGHIKLSRGRLIIKT